MSTDVVVAATRTWITDVIDGSSIQVGTRQTSGPSLALTGAVRYFAGNFAAAASIDQDVHTRTYTIAHISAADASWLYTRRGKTVLVRTYDGERFFAVYFTTSPLRHIGTTPDVDDGSGVTYDTDIEFTEVSYDESV